MSGKAIRNLIVIGLFALAHSAVWPSVELQGIQFPEKRELHVPFQATPAAPTARVVADVNYRNGQAYIELEYQYIKPAILFGGDVTCYVLWAISRDGQYENLGELVTRKASGRLEFATGKKSFAMMVTAEAYYLVGQPSELVVYTSSRPAQGGATITGFEFDGMSPAPRHSMDGIAHIKWDSNVPLELLQARKAYELASRNEAATHAPEIFVDAKSALDTANKLSGGSPKNRDLLDASRRAVALSNEALNITAHRIAALELEAALQRRREETAALEQRAADAETTAARAAELAERVRAEAELIRAEKARMMTETASLHEEKTGLETALQLMQQQRLQLESETHQLQTEMADQEREALRLQQDKTVLEQESLRLAREKEEVQNRLRSALSHVADTAQSVRGFVVNLPDILFDLNESTLKPEAQMVLAKLSGILLIMPEQGVLIEGHTDSTGDTEYNLDLSQRRANSVLEFLHSQGLKPRRLQAVGFGMQRPVADNNSQEGRKRNRRVEIVISAEAEEMHASG